MDNKQLLLKAIDQYDDYTLSQRSILKLLVKISVNEVAVISTNTISRVLKITNQTIHSAIRRFNKDDLVNYRYNAKLSKIYLNTNKLREIIQRFEQLQKLDHD